MPTYEYQCEKCGHELEAFQSMKAAPLRKCPACGKQALRRKISGGSGLIFKGTGFYITDYKNKPVEKKASGGEKAAPATPSEKKPAAPAAAN